MNDGSPDDRRSDGRVAIALFVGCLAAFVLSPVAYHSDPIWTIHTAMSLLRGQWGDLSGFAAVDPAHYSLIRRDGHAYMMFPIGTSVLIAPAVALMEWVSPDYAAYVERVNPPSLHRNVAAVICAAAVALFFLAARQRFPRGVAVAAAMILAFATGVWSTASRTLWSHGPLILCHAAALLIILGAERRPALAWLAGLPLGFAVIVRPTAAIVVVAMAAVVMLRWPRRLPAFVACVGGVLVPWIGFNLAIHGAVLPPYYQLSRLDGAGVFAEALLGHLVSPARGLFVFSPILLLAIPGFALAIRERRDRAVGVACGAILVAHWVAASRFGHWWGGHSFGPRLMADILPFAVFLCAYALESLAALARPSRRVAGGAVTALVLASVAINAQGALTGAAMRWNLTPVDIDRAPSRVWDWRDPQFLAAVRQRRGLP